MADLKNEIKKNNVVLLPLESGTFHQKIKELVKISSEMFKKVCYVTVRVPYETLKNHAESGKNPAEFFWIDCVTSTLKTPKPEEGVTFVASPENFKDIIKSFRETIKNRDIDFVVLDSISSLLVYEKNVEILQFIQNMIETVKKEKMKAVFVMLASDVSVEMMKDLAMFVDRVVEVG